MVKVFLLLLLLGILEVHHAKRPPKPGSKAAEMKGQTAEPEVYDDTSLSLEIQHSIGRGTIHLKSLKTSTGPLTFQQLPLLFSNFTSLRLAAKYGGFYFIRAKSKFTDLLSEKGATETTPGDYVATFISACALVNARLSDLITVIGDGQGNVIGLTLSIPVVAAELDCEDADEVELPGQFNTSVSLNNGMTAPSPDTQGFFQKIEKEEMDKDGTDNRSFLQKYWLYLVIGFVVFTLVNNAAASVTGGGGQ